jgi:hypothetical protein
VEVESKARRIIAEIERIENSDESKEKDKLKKCLLMEQKFFKALTISMLVMFCVFLSCVIIGVSISIERFLGIIVMSFVLISLIVSSLSYLNPEQRYLSEGFIARSSLMTKYNTLESFHNDKYLVVLSEFRNWVEWDLEQVICWDCNAVKSKNEARILYNDSRRLFQKLRSSDLQNWIGECISDSVFNEWNSLVNAVEIAQIQKEGKTINELSVSSENHYKQRENTLSQITKSASFNNHENQNTVSYIDAISSAKKKQVRRTIYTSSVKIDWLKLNELKSKIGNAGEEVVLEYEKHRLKNTNIDSLAEQIEHASVTQGDGLGYDIVSFDVNGDKIFIEVKTTTKDISAPLFFTSNEMAVMKKLGEAYYVYRVYNLNFETEDFELKIYKGAEIQESFEFEEYQFKAQLKFGR